MFGEGIKVDKGDTDSAFEKIEPCWQDADLERVLHLPTKSLGFGGLNLGLSRPYLRIGRCIRCRGHWLSRLHLKLRLVDHGFPCNVSFGCG
jgi:hypothetical protein